MQLLTWFELFENRKYPPKSQKTLLTWFELPWNGKYPQTMAYRTTPRDQTSTPVGEYGRLDTISGAAYEGDPHAFRSFWPSLNETLNPKSTILMFLFSSIKRLSSFTSLFRV